MSTGKIRPGAAQTTILPQAPDDGSNAAAATSTETNETSETNKSTASTTSKSTKFSTKGLKFAQEAQDTFDTLEADVKAKQLSSKDAKLLATESGQEGVIGEAEAVRAAKAAEALSPKDRTAFNSLVSSAASPEEKAFIYKALGAGYDLADVQSFAKSIQGWSADKLIHTLNLADDTGADDKVQNGVKQQFDASCTATTVQAVRGEMDPIYALQVRTQNKDINSVDDSNPDAVNSALAAEQRHLLQDIGGGKATPRNDTSGYGTWKIPEMLATESSHTGFNYTRVQITPCTDPQQLNTAMDNIAAQVSKGIPTPLIIGSPPDPSGHCILAMAVEGTGADRQFLVHDPWAGTTSWLSSSTILQGQLNIAGWPNLGYYYQATPAPLGAAVPPSTPTSPSTTSAGGPA
jgi:hypothetical protein